LKILKHTIVETQQFFDLNNFKHKVIKNMFKIYLKSLEYVCCVKSTSPPKKKCVFLSHSQPNVAINYDLVGIWQIAHFEFLLGGGDKINKAIINFVYTFKNKADD